MSSRYSREVEEGRHLARAVGVPFIDLREYRISPGILRKLSRDSVIDCRCVAMICNPRRVVVVVDDPSFMAILASDPSRLRIGGAGDGARGRSLEFAVTTSTALDETLERRLAIGD